MLDIFYRPRPTEHEFARVKITTAFDIERAIDLVEALGQPDGSDVPTAGMRPSRRHATVARLAPHAPPSRATYTEIPIRRPDFIEECSCGSCAMFRARRDRRQELLGIAVRRAGYEMDNMRAILATYGRGDYCDHSPRHDYVEGLTQRLIEKIEYPATE